MRFFAVLTLLFCMSCGRNDSADSSKNPNTPPPPSNDSTRGAPPGSYELAGTQQWKVGINWGVGPTVFDNNHPMSSATIWFSDLDGHPTKSITNVTVKPWMPDMGHGTGRFQPKVTVLDGERVRIDNIAFSMPGAWQLQITASVNGIQDQAKIAVNVKEP